MELLLPIIVAVVLIGLAWRLLAGLAKTVVLVAILVAAILYVFGVLG